MSDTTTQRSRRWAWRLPMIAVGLCAGALLARFELLPFALEGELTIKSATGDELSRGAWGDAWQDATDAPAVTAVFSQGGPLVLWMATDGAGRVSEIHVAPPFRQGGWQFERETDTDWNATVWFSEQSEMYTEPGPVPADATVYIDADADGVPESRKVVVDGTVSAEAQFSQDAWVPKEDQSADKPAGDG